MFGMSLTEIVIILALGLVVLGPEKIPEVAKFVGKALREVRKASNLLRDAVSLDDPEPARRVQPTGPNASKSFDSDFEPEPDPSKAEPSLERNIKVIRMAPRVETDTITHTTLEAAKPGIRHREVYLHIPYEETI